MYCSASATLWITSSDLIAVAVPLFGDLEREHDVSGQPDIELIHAG